MSKRTRIGLAGLFLAAVSGLAWLAVSNSGAKEPVYEGKRLREWLLAFDYDHRDQSGLSLRDARRAVHAAGTNAIPTLLQLLRTTDPPSKLKLIELLQKQHFIKIQFRTAAGFHDEAMMAFQELGVRAAVAVPELIKMYNEVPPLPSQNTIAYVLSGIGSAAQAAIPSLQRQLANTNQYVANAARNALDDITRSAGQPRGRLDLYFIPLHWQANGQFGAGRHDPGVPELLEMIKRPGPDGYWAKFVLEQIDPDTAARVITNDDTVVDLAKPAISNSEPGNSTRLLSVGEWSDSVTGYRAGLRGRLLVYAAPHYTNRLGEWWGDVPVKVELQTVDFAIEPVPEAVYFDASHGFEVELRDAKGNPALHTSDVPGPPAPEFWVTVPFDGEVGFCVDSSSQASLSKPNGLTLHLARQIWRIPPDNTNDYFLSATFTPPTNHPNPLNYYVWGGTLKLPPVKIVISNP